MAGTLCQGTTSAVPQKPQNQRGFTGCGKTLCLLVIPAFFFHLIFPIIMRGDGQKQATMFIYLTLAQRIPADHPARQIRALMDRALERMDAKLEQLYSNTGRPSIAPERLLRATLLMILFSIRSERQLMEQMNYNLLFRRVWHPCGNLV
jgi:hypothetical protein